MAPSPSPAPSVSPTRFVGREAALAALGARIETDALITVVGPPGVGKSRLALELVRRKGAEACWVELGCATDIDSFLAALGRGLDVALAAGATPEALVGQLAAALARRGPVLLVLDDGSRLEASAIKLLSSLRTGAPAARVLVTSRERLGVPGETLFDLGPLSLPTDDGGSGAESEAVALFLERAR